MEKELEELVYSLEDLIIDEPIKVQMNTGAAGAPVKEEKKYNFEAGTSSMPINKKNTSRIRPDKDKASIEYTYLPSGKYIPNRHLPMTSSQGFRFLNIDCKLDPVKVLQQWGQDMGLYFLSDKSSNFSLEEKYRICTASFDGNIKNCYTGVTESTRNIIRTHTIKDFDTSVTNGIDRIITYIGDKFFGYECHDKKEAARNAEK